MNGHFLLLQHTIEGASKPVDQYSQEELAPSNYHRKDCGRVLAMQQLRTTLSSRVRNRDQRTKCGRPVTAVMRRVFRPKAVIGITMDNVAQ